MAIRLEILKIKNLTAEVDILGARGPLEVVECGASTVAFILDQPLREGVLISLEVRLAFAGRIRLFPVAGKVLGCALAGQGTHHIRVQLRQYDKELWGPLVRALAGDQDRVDRLFAAIKGES